MPGRDARVDAYIEGAEPFARPILRHLRDVVHQAAPRVEETIKWGFPHFTFQGLLCRMAAFKAHCAFGFWKESLVLEGLEPPEREAMGQFGRITAIEDLPPADVLAGYVRKAVRLNEEGVKVPRRPSRRGPDPAMPEAFRVALEENPEAKTVFDGFSPSHRREYLEWIAEAKRGETRARRIRTAVEWIAEGKPRNWKYMGAGP